MPRRFFLPKSDVLALKPHKVKEMWDADRITVSQVQRYLLWRTEAGLVTDQP